MKQPIKCLANAGRRVQEQSVADTKEKLGPHDPEDSLKW